jgi:catechol 2,3-dioxygenase-like lactoylglutathione lyase family enzyme
MASRDPRRRARRVSPVEGIMTSHVHHVHIFASDIDKSIRFYRDFFGGVVVLDTEVALARNVFMRVGTGRIHFYDQPPKGRERGPIHHVGIQTDDIDGVVGRMKEAGVPFRKEIADFGFWKYVMVGAPDDVLIELFEVDKTKIPRELVDYFD